MSGTTSTHKRTSPGSSRKSPSPDSDYLPPPRKSDTLKPVSLPLQNTSLRKLIYILVILTTLLMAFYSYRFVQYKKAVGGWWNIALGRGPIVGGMGEGQMFEKNPNLSSDSGIEDRIKGLAIALGIPSKDLASAIAIAVRNYVPSASLTSGAAKKTILG